MIVVESIERKMLSIIKNKYIRIIFRIAFTVFHITVAIFLIAAVAFVLFNRTPRTDKEIQEFIAQSQIDYPLPDETIGRPQTTKDKTGEFVSIPPPEQKSRMLKITKRDGKFYWDSWKGQELGVIRGHYYVADLTMPSTIFISKENDGIIRIYEGINSPATFCGYFGLGGVTSSYLEIRSSTDAEVKVIRGQTGAHYPYGVVEEVCAEDFTGYESNLYLKPSLYQRIKELFSQRE